jgi:hypothetical protein
MVRANVNPNGAGNKAVITKPNVPPGQGVSAYLPQESGALTNFQGVVFIQTSNASAKIAATSNSTNYSTLGAGAQYGCINY